LGHYLVPRFVWDLFVGLLFARSLWWTMKASSLEESKTILFTVLSFLRAARE
jgi:hypothetical protein